MEQPFHIAILRNSAIGDVVLATASLQYLQHCGLPLRISWIGREPALSLIRAAYPAVQTLIFKDPASFSALKGVHLLLDLQDNFATWRFAWQLQRKTGCHVARYSKTRWQRSLWVQCARWRGRRKALPAYLTEHSNWQYQRMLGGLEAGLRKLLSPADFARLPTFSTVPLLPTYHNQDLHPLGLAETKLWLAVAPGASYATKRAPTAFFLQILKEIVQEASVSTRDGKKASQVSGRKEQLGLVFLGDKNDALVAAELIKDLGYEGPCVNLAGQLSLWESALVLRAARSLLCNDSGLAHIAEAMETPVAVLFGPTVEAFGFAPQLKESRALSARLGCRPCSKHGKSPCRYGDQKCFWDISGVSAVLRKQLGH